MAMGSAGDTIRFSAGKDRYQTKEKNDEKDEEKESTLLIILFPTCWNSLLPDFLQGS